MKRYLSALMAIVIAISLFAIAPETTQAATMSISETERTITEKEQFRLFINHCTSKVTWNSKDKSVAKVSSKGIVTGVKAGSTTIIAKTGKKTYKCNVQVITSMSKELSALASKFSYHYFSGHYVNAEKITIRSIARGSYVISRDDLSISSYDYKMVYSGYLNSGVQQSCVAFYNSKRDFMMEMPEEHSSNGLTEKTEYVFSADQVKEVEQRARLIGSDCYDPKADDGTIKLNNNDLTMCIGDTYMLKVLNTTNKAKWSSSKSSVATVSNGKITAKKTGTTTIKAIVDGVTVRATVYVIKKYNKDMRTLINSVGTMKSRCEYPDDLTVTNVQFGTFKNAFSEGMESLHDVTHGNYFAMITITGKNVKGLSHKEYWGIGYDKNGDWVVDSIFDEGRLSPEGAVTNCTAEQLKEVNLLMKNGKGRLLILPKK